MPRESLAFAFALRGPQHVIEAFNPLILRLVANLEPADVIGKRCAEVFPTIAEHYLPAIDRVFRTGEPYAGQEALTANHTADGLQSLRYFDFVMLPMRNQSGAIDGITAFAFEVTDQVQARAAALDVERRYHFALDALPCIAWSSSRGAVTEYVNRAWTEFSGCTASDPSTIDWTEYVHPDDARILAEFDRTSTERWSAEYRMRRHDGVYRWFLGRSVPFLDASGKPYQHFGTATEIHDQKEASERLALLAAAGEVLSATLDVRAMLRDLARVVVPAFADRCAIDLLVEARVERIASVPDVLPELPPAPPNGIGLPLVVEGRAIGTIVFANDGSRTYDARDYAFAEELARRAAISISNAQLFAREREARHELHRANERLALLARTGEIFTSSIDYEDTLQSVVTCALPMLADFCFFDVVEEGRMRRIFGVHDDPSVAALFADTVWGTDNATDATAMSTGLSSYHPAIDEAKLHAITASETQLARVRASGVCSMISVPLRHNGELLGALTLCFGKSARQHVPDDVTFAEELARRAANAVVQARLHRDTLVAAHRAETANRLKDEFLATVSHELRTPLNAIVGWAALLRNGPPPSVSIERGIEVIHKNSLIQARIVDDILDVSRIAGGRMTLTTQPLKLADVVRDAVDAVRAMAEAKRISVTFSAARVAPSIVGDPERLRQVGWNLLSNAVKFTDEGGQVKVGVGACEEHVQLTISDTGMGIAPDFLPLVFDRFRQADSSTTRAHGGLGLGLAIVRHIVELHGGRVTAESAGPGQGSTFCVTLPVAKLAAP